MPKVHNALDRATGLVRGFRRALGILGPEGGVERMGETLTPIIDIWSNPRWAVLMEDRLQFGCAVVTAGGAGFRSQVQLSPALSSKCIIIIHLIEGSAAFNIKTLFPGVVLGTAETNRGARDSRNSDDQRAVLRSSNGAAAVGNLRFRVMSAPYRFEQPLIVHSDSANVGSIVADALTDNLAIDLSFVWTTHSLFPGEEAGA